MMTTSLYSLIEKPLVNCWVIKKKEFSGKWCWLNQPKSPWHVVGVTLLNLMSHNKITIKWELDGGYVSTLFSKKTMYIMLSDICFCSSCARVWLVYFLIIFSLFWSLVRWNMVPPCLGLRTCTLFRFENMYLVYHFKKRNGLVNMWLNMLFLN